MVALAMIVVEESRQAARAPIHGERHWKDVARYAVRLAHKSGGDPEVAFLFGLLHDTQRRNEFSDPEHGQRAADYMLSLVCRELSGLTSTQVDALVYALDYHDTGMVTMDPTIGACWDADRVTLWRVQVTPESRYMSTVEAQNRPHMAYKDIFRPTSWSAIAACV